MKHPDDQNAESNIMPPSNKEGMETSHGRVTRRGFVKSTATAIGAMAAVGLTGVMTKLARAAVPAPQGGGKYKVIDWRCRPPLKPYTGLFNLRLNFLGKRPNKVAAPTSFGEVPPAVSMVGKPGAMEEWWKEIDAAGVDIVVANGRYAAGDPLMSMDNPTLTDLQKQYPGRFYGLAALNLDQPMEKTISELEDAIKNKGLRGANLEPGYRTKNGGAATIDNADFYPIFESMSALGYPLMVQTGAFAGVDNWGAANETWRFDSVMGKFPKLKMLLAHGGYPSIPETLALALKHPGVSICPDCYMFWPGGQLYQQNLEMLPDQFVYGSAFPFGNIDTTIQQTLKLPISEGTMRKYLYENAAALLKL